MVLYHTGSFFYILYIDSLRHSFFKFCHIFYFFDNLSVWRTIFFAADVIGIGYKYLRNGFLNNCRQNEIAKKSLSASTYPIRDLHDY